MDYLKWLVLNKHREIFTDGIIVPIIFLNFLLIAITSAAFAPVGIFLAVLSVALWSVPIFFFAQEAYQKSLEEFKKSRK